MSSIGWIIMLTSVIGMTILFSWCIFKVLNHKDSSQQIHLPADIDPQDQK